MIFGKHSDGASDDQTEEKFPAGGQVSEGPSGLGDLETSIGGADSVPDTPDTMPPLERGAGPEAQT